METQTQATLETLNDGLKTTPFEISEEAFEVISGGLHIGVHPDLQNPVFGWWRIIEFNFDIPQLPYV